MNHLSKNLVVLCLVLLCSGCGHVKVAASGPKPFPAVRAGGMAELAPGEYACPASLPSGVRIIGVGTIFTPDMLSDSFAPLSAAAAPVVRIVCNHDLKLSSVAGLDVSGVVFDFNGAGGLVLDSVNYSRFDIGIVNSTTALTLEATSGNNFGNVFPRLVIFNTGTGVMLRGVNSKAVTWNDFGHVDIVHAHDAGIVVSQFSDTNTFAAVRMHLNGSAQGGLILNDQNTLGDVDASGNVFGLLNCDAESGFAGYCADFRGYTVGNHVTIGFGIMADANKMHFANAFSQSANTVVKLQEQPKQP